MEFSAATTLRATDWERWACRNVTVDDGGIEIASEPSVRIEQLSFPAVDIAVGPDGTQYALRPSGAVYRHDQQRGIQHALLGADSHDLPDPSGLCVSGDRLYVLDTSGTVAVVSTRLQQPIGTIETGLRMPVTITAAAGRLYLLDTAVGSVVSLQSDGTVETVFGSLSSPIDMTVADNGAIYVLDKQDDHRPIQKQSSTGEILDGRILEGRHRVVRKRSSNGDTDPGRFPLSDFETASGESLTPTRLTSPPDSPLLLVGQTTDDRSVVVDVDPETSKVRKRGRLGSDCRTMCSPHAANGSYAVIDETTTLRLDPTVRRVSDSDAGGCVGRAYQQFDSGTNAVQWHRLVVDRGRSTAGTQLRVSYFANDDPSPLDESISSLTGLSDSLLSTAGIETVWDLLATDPTTLAACSEELSAEDVRGCFDTAFEAVETATADQWKTVESPTDLLVSEAIGRYLTVRLELIGGPTVSPRVDSVRAVWPRQSYLQYLPEVYQDPSGSAAFLEQFLSVFGTAFSEFERETDTITQYLDPEAVPTEALPWLAEWLGVDRIDWPTPAVRELVAAAPQLYKTRGTKSGLRDLLMLYLSQLSPPNTPPTDRLVPDDRPLTTVDVAPSAVDHGLFILEPDDLNTIESAPAKQAYEAPLSGSRSIAVFAGPFTESDHREAIVEIIQQQTPAHVDGSLVELESELTLGGTTFLGVNSRLGDRCLELGEAALGGTTVLE